MLINQAKSHDNLLDFFILVLLSFFKLKIACTMRFDSKLSKLDSLKNEQTLSKDGMNTFVSFQACFRQLNFLNVSITFSPLASSKCGTGSMQKGPPPSFFSERLQTLELTPKTF